ncbi:hypothetical protein FHU36_005469 [Nonomuraea muscovyensis]|uniref:DprA winged helix domain-containing protein n=1 Tax=Nonomuraea muscovyensis TaxID=1124761 RepID=A0A7X0C5J2_9ACTN|nr:hypothetical protein [Nonomuraea muscovyensis]MBB6348924.1 hypothetical protein [Nonomuraea muscovyensis]
MTRADDATAHVLARAGGPLRLGAGVAAPAGMLRLTRPDSTGEALPVWPDGATPSLLEEYQVAPVPVERAGETRRVLAACLKCCWTDQSADPWPGDPAPVELVLDTYRALIGRTDDLMRNWAIGALRRLHDSAWIVMADGLITLGPRCALWPVESYAQLKELVRRLPDPERTALTVVADADIVAAARPDTPAPDPATQASPVLASSTRPDTTDHPPSTPEPDTALHRPSTPEPHTTPHRPSTPEPHTTPHRPSTPGPDTTHRPSTLGPDTTHRGPSTAGRDVSAVRARLGGQAEAGAAEFDDLLGGYDERRRAELVAAFVAVEHAGEPVLEARFLALRDPALRHSLGEMLARRGRTLIQHRERWISGYDDHTAARAARLLGDGGDLPSPGGARSGGQGPGGPASLGEAEKAVLTLVLVHSVAIPRAEGVLPEDTWSSPHPTPVDELRRHTQVPIGELEAALRTLRHAGLLTQVKAGEEAGGYVPGPQFHRLTPAVRRRLQEELILAAGPHSPLAGAVRARRSAE